MTKTIALSLVVAAAISLSACKKEAAANNAANATANTANAASNTMKAAASNVSNAANTVNAAAANTAKK